MGALVGSEVVGEDVGERVGPAVVGDMVGGWVGSLVGDSVGDSVGRRVGMAVGIAVGAAVGATVVGAAVGIPRTPFRLRHDPGKDAPCPSGVFGQDIGILLVKQPKETSIAGTPQHARPCAYTCGLASGQYHGAQEPAAGGPTPQSLSEH